MQERIIQSILENKIVVIVRGMDRETLIPFADALYEGGIRLMEVTYRADDPQSDEATAETIRILAERMEGKMFVGAGTVIRRRQVELTKRAGGRFIISPDTNADIICYTKELGLVSIPGALTPSEITAADRAGADFVKLFPISALGPSYVKAVIAPLSHVRLLAVGGVNLSNMEAYAAAGVKGFGIGAQFVDPALIRNRDFKAIASAARKYTETVAAL